MNITKLVRGLALAIAVIISSVVVPPTVSADCYTPKDGQVIGIKVESCEVIDGKTNKEVLKYGGEAQKASNIQKLYDGALVTEESGARWMYPTSEANPCQKFPKSALVKMRAYLTCCDTGRWGKCVFGGRWLGDADGKPVNAFQ